ncbi:hypothetical protein BH24CHL9_BH24CHL9_11960 [soil metagenome]
MWIRDRPEAEAVAALESAGLVPGERLERDNDQVDPGSVIRTRPQAGEPVEQGSAIDLFVAAVPATPEPISVPDLVGLAEPDAIAALESAGLVAGERSEATDPDIPADTVIAQAPAAGEAAAEGDAVALTVSAGPEEEPEPPADDLLAKVQAAGVLRVNIDPDDPGWSVVRPNGETRGYSVQVATRVAEILGVEVSFSTEPLEEVLAGGWSDRWDIAFGHLVSTDARAGALVFTQPYAWEPITLAVSDDSGLSPDDLSGGAVCVAAGSVAQGWFEGSVSLVDAAGATAAPPPIASLVTAESGEDCLAAILDGSSQGWAASAPDIASAIENGAAIQSSAPASWAPIAAAVDSAVPGFETLLGAVDAAITALRDDGTLSQLSDRALGADVSSPPDGVTP